MKHQFKQLLCVSVAMIAAAAPITAQKKPDPKAAATPSIVGTWAGTATVPLGDSAIVLPVTYTFAQTGDVVGGTAMVPGQGMGPISHVVRDGAKILFRVTVTTPPAAGATPQTPTVNLLEHDGKLGADGAIEGMVNLNAKPVAKFRITPKK